MLMDHMLPFVGHRRQEVRVEREYISESEEELNEDIYVH